MKTKRTTSLQAHLACLTLTALGLALGCTEPGSEPSHGDPREGVLKQHVGGGVTNNGTPTGLVTANGFLFEPEVPYASLKQVPTWPELEQMLDNPYGVTWDPATPGNLAGFPSYRASGVIRRPSFGVTLPQLLVHPLNYNTTTGEEMRLLNPRYRGGRFNVTDELVEGPPGTYTWMRTPAVISPGSQRIECGLPSPIDYNNPIGADPEVCVVVLEQNPPEGSIMCGGDPGEPGYYGLGVLKTSLNYSTPAVPLSTTTPTAPSTPLPPGKMLYDPARQTASMGGISGYIPPRNPISGQYGLRKPSLRIPQNGGRPANPNYMINSNCTEEETVQSSENDYIQNRPAAMVLGKALFWDMQVGSDGVQSCGTCHFNGTGTDTRTKNQVNPNQVDNTFQLMQPNERDLVAADFPLHKLTNPEVAGDPACTTPILASVNPGVLENNFPGGVTNLPVCDAANLERDTNDVVSSMGVVFSPFTDIAPVGAFQPPSNGVAAVRPDLRTVGYPDPIPGFQGLRRVEPRNTPTMQAAGFNFDNFWDGRGRHDFNGGNVFGASDPQSHVFVGGVYGGLTPTRQIIRFVSVASTATGPALSEFEMSFLGRNWAKIAKKLLQGTRNPAGLIVGTVTPLANQLVDPTDSVMGIYSNQGGSACAALAAHDRAPGTPAVGKPGLCISYQGLIRKSFFPALWRNNGSHLKGCYTGGTNTPQCASPPSIAVLAADGTVDEDNHIDPFDNYVLKPSYGPARLTDTNQFTHMEGNFSLFWGLSINAWIQILVPDDTPFDNFLEANPGAFASMGEPGEPGLVEDLLGCGYPTPVVGDVNDPNYCFKEWGNFKRDPNVSALRKPTGENAVGGTMVPSPGTRNPATDPDPLLGLDIFFSSNLSLKNPNFRTARCGECHAIPTLTDHTMPFTSKINLMDSINEFSVPGIELIVEPLARLRVITGFLLESELMENGQDAVERRIVDQSIVPNPVDGLAYPGATAAGLPGFGPWTGADSAFLDNGMYNLGVRPIAEDTGRGGNDPFGWPFSLTTLMMKNLGGPGFNPGGDDPSNNFAQPPGLGAVMNTFDPDEEGFGLFEETGQDQQINPGFEGEPANPLLPEYLAEFANNITVGDFPPEMDEAGGAIGGMINTLTDVAMIEGFMDTLGPFNPGNVSAEVMNYGGLSDRPGDTRAQMGTWPNVNRVGRMGSFKAPQLRNIEFTGPYFHNGGLLTLRQVVDFYTRGGDFPISNKGHRDFNLVNMNIEVQSNLSEAEKAALVDLLLEFTDERNRFAKAPFDHPEVLVPVDGRAPDATTGRAGMLAAMCGGSPCFMQVPAVGAAGQATPEPTFLNVTKIRVTGADAVRGSPECDFDGTAGTHRVSQYCR